MNEKNKQILSQILAEMSPTKRDILLSFFLDHLKRDELCDRFGVTEDYVRVLLFRTKEEFSARLKRKGWNGSGDDDAPAVRCS